LTLEWTETGPGVVATIKVVGRGGVLVAASDGLGALILGAGAIPALSSRGDSGSSAAAAAPGHHIVAVNGVTASAQGMAEELCRCRGLARMVVRSGWMLDGARLEIRSLYAGYAGQESLFRGLVLDVEPRRRVAITGEPGAGKSTLLLSILRVLAPRQGRILLNGVDTAAIGHRCLTQAVGMVPQEPLLFSGSLRSNLDPEGTRGDDDLLDALRHAGLERLIHAGAEALARDAPGNVSRREQRLLAVARAILFKPPLLLLDEVACGATEIRCIQALHQDLPRSTIIAIVKQSEALKGFDRVLAFKDGLLQEQRLETAGRG